MSLALRYHHWMHWSRSASGQSRWLTHWRRDNKPWRLELVFLERTQEGSAVLVIAPDAPVGVPGRYPMPAGYLDQARYGTLDGVRFRVCRTISLCANR